MFSLATWNVNSIKMRLAHVIEWLTKHQPDVLALQETKIQDANFPYQPFNEIGYEVIFSGQKSYNGVAIVSRKPATNVLKALPGLGDEQQRFLAVTIDDIRIINVYIPNGHVVGSEKYEYKLKWLDAFKSHLNEEMNKTQQLVVVGDYNIAPEDRDVYDPIAWQGQVLVSPKERQAFQDLLACGLTDTFRLFEQTTVIYSWWDYRALSLPFNHGLRIDHILASRELSQRCISCEIDKAPRKLKSPSDHAPVIAKFDI